MGPRPPAPAETAGSPSTDDPPRIADQPSATDPPRTADPSPPTDPPPAAGHRRWSRRGVLSALGGVSVLGAAAWSARSAGTDDGAALEPTGTLEVPGLSEVVPGPDGRVAYGAIPSGFVSIDLADPANPTVLAEVTEVLPEDEPGQLAGVFDVAVDGDRLAVGGPRASFLDTVRAIAVYDVADPADPTRLAVGRIGHAVHNLDLDGETVYATGHGYRQGPLVAHDAGTLEERWRWSVVDAHFGWSSVGTSYRNCHDVVVQDGVAYAAFWDAGTWLLDVTGDEPTPLGQVGGVHRDDAEIEGGMFELPGNAHYAAPDATGDLLAVGKEAGDHPETRWEGGPGGVHLWDVTDRGDPEPLAMLPPARTPDGEGHTSHNFGFRGDRLYTSWYRGGVRVYDVADPTAPRDLGGYQAGETTSFWTARPIHAGFVASSYRDPSKEDSRDGATLFTFPEPDDGGQAVRSPTVTPGVTPRETATPEVTPTRTPRSRSPTASPTPSPTPSPVDPTETGPTTPTDTEPATSRTSPGSSGETPGLGAGAALLALGVGVWRHLRTGEE